MSTLAAAVAARLPAPALCEACRGVLMIWYRRNESKRRGTPQFAAFHPRTKAVARCPWTGHFWPSAASEAEARARATGAPRP